MALMGAFEVTAEAEEQAVPLVFGGEQRPLFGVFHAARGRSPRDVGVVLCNPLGHEAMSIHRSYRHLAERIARAGLPALRFDYQGTGDSPGEGDDPGRVQAWKQDVRLAVEELRARGGCPRIAVVGTRFGATLAAVAAAELGGVASLVAWAPVAVGSQHVRELRVMRMMRRRAEKRADGAEEVAGYVFSRETLAEMAAIDLLARREKVADRVLLLQGARPGQEAALGRHWESLGAAVSARKENGYAAMMRDDPYESEVPEATLDGIVEWLREGTRPAALHPTVAPVQRTLEVEAPSGGPPLRETLVRFGQGERLFGVITDPARPRSPAPPTVCLLNVGSNHHVGPHRMGVLLARRFAALGYPIFRFDVAGFGDSRAHPGTPENRLYRRESVQDVVAAMNALAKARGAERFVLVGLCSGAYLAYHAAVQDTRVVGQALLSPFAFEYREGDSVTPRTRTPTRAVHDIHGVHGATESAAHNVWNAWRSTRSYLLALRDVESWRRLLRGQIDPRRHARVLLERAGTWAADAAQAAVARLGGDDGARNDIERGFRALGARGVESLVVLGFEDGGLDMIGGYLGHDARRMRGRPGFEFRVLHEVDHTFTDLSAQAILSDLLESFLTTRFR